MVPNSAAAALQVCQNRAMQLQKYLVPLASAVGLVAAYQAYGWAGVAIAGGALVMWLLLHFTRMMTVLQRAARYFCNCIA